MSKREEWKIVLMNQRAEKPFQRYAIIAIPYEEWDYPYEIATGLTKENASRIVGAHNAMKL